MIRKLGAFRLGVVNRLAERFSFPPPEFPKTRIPTNNSKTGWTSPIICIEYSRQPVTSTSKHHKNRGNDHVHATHYEQVNRGNDSRTAHGRNRDQPHTRARIIRLHRVRKRCPRISLQSVTNRDKSTPVIVAGFSGQRKLSCIGLLCIFLVLK